MLDQVSRPKLVVCDTMNYWIQGKKAALLELLKRVDILMVNDSEARELSRRLEHSPGGPLDPRPGAEARRHQAGRARRAADRAESRTFYVPAYPLEEVFDPTGAGDAFAGGFMGYLARTGDVSDDNLRRAMVYGATMGSFAVEQFGIRGFEGVTLKDVETRARAFRDLTHVALAEEIV